MTIAILVRSIDDGHHLLLGQNISYIYVNDDTRTFPLLLTGQNAMREPSAKIIVGLFTLHYD